MARYNRETDLEKADMKTAAPELNGTAVKYALIILSTRMRFDIRCLRL